MKGIYIALILLLSLSCRESPKKSLGGDLTAQEIVDRAIAVSGGAKYRDHSGSFVLRDYRYAFGHKAGKSVLQRSFRSGTDSIVDVRYANGFQRYVNGHAVQLPDSMAVKYANSINSVHYFVRLPQGLNDGAVNKELLGTESLGGKQYHKIRVTFDQKGGGDDFEDTYIYWFDTQSFETDYLAYDFHVQGGGQRFRKAYNPRDVKGIRFVDYENYKPNSTGSALEDRGQLYESGELQLLSKVELTAIQVVPEN